MKVDWMIVRSKKRRLDFDGEAGPDSHLEKGQGLVETAIILPILLLMLLGVFEVGWALRGYLVLANLNREATRFAARGIYLDFDNAAGVDPVCSGDEFGIGYCKVISHTFNSLSSQLPLDLFGLDPNGSMIITYYNIEPRPNFNCAGDPNCINFECQRFADSSRADFIPMTDQDDLNTIEYPLLTLSNPAPLPPPNGAEPVPGYYGQVLTFDNTIPISAFHHHRGAAVYSRIDPQQQVAGLMQQTNAFNCELVKKRLPPKDNNNIIIENIYYQDQLLGLPFFTVFVPDPVRFYTHTAMRVDSNIRLEEDNSVRCELYPIIIPIPPSFQPGITRTISLATGAVPAGNQYTFTDWGPTTTLADDFDTPANATTAYSYPPLSDTELSNGDRVFLSANPAADFTGVSATLLGLQTGQTIMRVPSWGSTDGVSSAQVDGFWQVQIVNVNPGNGDITFSYRAADPGACPGTVP